MDPTLEEQIANAEAALAAADNVTARHRAGRHLDALNAAKLAHVRTRTDHNGQLRPEPDAAPAASAAPGPTTPPVGSFDGGVQPHTPTPTLDEQIAEAQARGDWTNADRLNAAKLAQATTRQRARDLNPASAL